MLFTDELNIQKHINLKSNVILIFKIYFNIRNIYTRRIHKVVCFENELLYQIVKCLSSTISLEYLRIVVIIAPRSHAAIAGSDDKRQITLTLVESQSGILYII